jgi:II/X family phage/plasmid replication protein
MIDTLKLLVPIKDPELLSKIADTFERSRKEDLRTREVKWEYHSANIKLGSYSRSVNLKISVNPSGIFAELSFPKYAKGNNVEMLYPHEIPAIADKLYQELCTFCGQVLPPVDTWPVYRLDICYNWFFESAEQAQQAIDFIKRIEFPRKKMHVWDTSVMHMGPAYTVNFYMKGPEFKTHDFKVIKEKDSKRAYFLQEKANHVLRFEVGLKHRYLPKFIDKKVVLIADIADDAIIEKMLIHFLDKTFFYINTTTMTNAEIQQKLLDRYTKPKATRLYGFYKGYYLDPEMKSLYHLGGLNRSTIYRNKKDLKHAGVGFALVDANTGKGILEQLIIPSPSSRFDFPDALATMPV